MPARKYVRKARKAAVGFAKKRYTTRTGGTRVKQLARDVYKIQRSLNVEHKHIDYTIGSAGILATQRPTKNTPIIIALNTPVRGTSFNNRVGNQLRVVHMTAKYQFTFHNNSDLVQRTSVRARIIFAKNADHVPVIEDLLHADPNGHYTDLSFTNTQEYKKFLWIKSLDTKASYKQPTNRYPPSSGSAETTNPQPDSTAKFAVTDVAAQALNIAPIFKRAAAKTSVRMMFQNNTDTVDMMKPYLVLTSDIIEAAGDDYDYINVSAQIRMTYVDN